MLWIKCFHVLAVMAWLAGIFYLPRIFVHYGAGQAAGEDVRRLAIMARKLFGFMSIMALLAIGLGLWLWLGFHDTGRWLMFKLGFVAGLIAYHLSCRILLRRIRLGRSLPSGLALRLFNEAGLLLVVPILILAIVKPF